MPFWAVDKKREHMQKAISNQSFVRFIAETQDKRSKMFTLSELMILHYLREHQKITLKQAEKTIQETDDNAHKVLNALRDEGLLELNGKTYAYLSRSTCSAADT